MRRDAEPLHIDPGLHTCLKQAIDPQEMRRWLERGWRWCANRGFTIDEVAIHRVFPRGRDQFIVKYRITLRTGDRRWEQTLFGEIQPGDADARRRTIVEKLRKSRRKQIDRRGDCYAIDAIAPLGLVLRLPGFDERLPGLTLLHRANRSRRFFLERFPELDPGLRPEIDILNHRPAKRCVLRVRPFPEQERGIVLRCLNEKRTRHRENHRHMEALRAAGFAEGDDRIEIPRPLFHDDALATIAIEEIAGATMLNGESGLPLHREAHMAGAVLGKLHRTDLHLPKRYETEEELAMLERWTRFTRQLRPDLDATLGRGLAEVGRQLRRLRETPPRPIHRDYYGKQLLFDGQRTILIDFDTLCMGDPAIDIGNYLAHRTFEMISGQLPQHDAQTPFLEGYERRAPLPPAASIAAWRNAALLRMACLYALHTGWEEVPVRLLSRIEGRPAA